jgi:hypothetical protein
MNMCGTKDNVMLAAFLPAGILYDSAGAPLGRMENFDSGRKASVMIRRTCWPIMFQVTCSLIARGSAAGSHVHKWQFDRSDCEQRPKAHPAPDSHSEVFEKLNSLISPPDSIHDSGEFISTTKTPFISQE